MEHMTEYYNFKETLSGKANLLTLEQIAKYKTDPNKDYYISLYKYNDNHLKKFKETGTLAGIKDVQTDVLFWDFDNKDDLQKVKDDVLTLAHRLVDQYNVDPDQIQAFTSGNKGMHVVVPIGKNITPDEFKAATAKLADGLTTFDTVVSDPQRIIRLEYTKHPKSGLYKVPLHIAEVEELSLEQIKEVSKTIREVQFNTNPVVLPNSLFETPKKKEPTISSNSSMNVLDFSKKPKGMNEYVYALLEGHYESGERHQALMVLAAKCRSMGYDKEATFYLCKSSLKKQARRTNAEEFDKSELWNNIIEQSIYSDRWEGGSYSPKNNLWLRNYCDRYKIRWGSLSESNIISPTEAFDSFHNFATNIDNLTIKTGIEELDASLRLTVGMSAGLVASPGVGKTSVSLQMLNNMSKEGHRSLFFSYDMYAPIVYQKLVQKHFNIGSTAMFEKFKKDTKFQEQVKQKIAEEYAKVSFCFKTGQTINDIVDTIKEAEDKNGEKVKFIVVDYNELVITDYSDSTQSSAFVAQKMREIAQSMDMCVFSLFQPSKISGTPADEIKSYNSAKGSGAISQSVSVMLGMSRPGYNPQAPENDKFINLACLKNRMGPLFSVDFGWEGFTGTISTLNDEERQELKNIREKRIAAEEAKGSWV